MKTILLVLSVLAVGCNRSEYSSICKTDLVGLAGGESEKLVCGRLIYDIRVVRKIMMTEQTREDGTRFLTIKDEAEWAHVFHDAAIWVSKDQNQSNPYGVGEDVSGSYSDITGEIRVGSDLMSLLHECYHRVDVVRGNTVDTSFHKNWDTNGYDKMDLVYKHKFLGSDAEFHSREVNGFLDEGDTM